MGKRLGQTCHQRNHLETFNSLRTLWVLCPSSVRLAQSSIWSRANSFPMIEASESLWAALSSLALCLAYSRRLTSGEAHFHLFNLGKPLALPGGSSPTLWHRNSPQEEKLGSCSAHLIVSSLPEITVVCCLEGGGWVFMSWKPRFPTAGPMV